MYPLKLQKTLCQVVNSLSVGGLGGAEIDPVSRSVATDTNRVFHPKKQRPTSSRALRFRGPPMVLPGSGVRVDLMGRFLCSWSWLEVAFSILN